MKTAILVAGGFFLKRYKYSFGRDKDPKEVADFLHSYCYKHLQEKEYDNEHKEKPKYKTKNEMYRIFYYDCAPLDCTVYHPLDGNINLKQGHTYIWTHNFFNELKKKRKVALRLGELSMNKTEYALKSKTFKKLIKKDIDVDDLTSYDFNLNVEQKGVDMRLGLDVASLAYKKQVEKIVLIAGDSDFVPVAKMARREGIDFILDPLYNRIKDNLLEHIDGLYTFDTRFSSRYEPEPTSAIDSTKI